MWKLWSNKALVGLLLALTPLTSVPVEFGKVVMESVIDQNSEVVDLLYLASKNPNVVDSFKFSVPEAQAAYDSSELEYSVDVGPVNGSTAANYVYGSFFNPSASGRTVVIKRISVRAIATTTANYVNLSVRRTTAAPAGTQIAAADIPRKNSGSSNPVAEVRHTGVTVTLANAVQSRLLGQPMPGVGGNDYSNRDITFGANDEKIILQTGEGIALYQEAAGDPDQKIRISVEWEEVTSTPTAENEYMIAIQRVENAASANYVYNSFFNPSGSGKTALVKRIWYGSETCDAAAVYTNNVVVRRISAASSGTLIAAADVPKKHTGSSNSVVQIRYTGVTVTAVGGADARLAQVTPCGAAGQLGGWHEQNFAPNDEPLVLQPGEGIALMSDATGDVDQFNRMFVEWEEVVSAPSADNHYMAASPRVEVAGALGTTMYTYFNPSGSGKTMLVKRLGIRVNSDTASTFSALNFQRITAASAGTLIAATDIPKKHTGSSNSAMEVRWCGAACASTITVTYSGSRSIVGNGVSDSGILKAIAPGNIAQMSGRREIVFGDNEPFVLQEGEGIGFYINYVAGDIDHYNKVFVEWEEVASAPATENEYLIDIGPVPGNVATSYNYASFLNPSASGKAIIIKRISPQIDALTTATYAPFRVRRISTASGGTLIAAADIPKKHTGSSNSVAEIRRTGVTLSFTGGTGAQIMSLRAPGTVGLVTANSLSGYTEHLYTNDEPIILKPGEGIALNHDTTAADADQRILFLIEWEEVDIANIPTALDNHIVALGPVTSVTTSGYVYASLFNPVSSGKAYVLQRLGIRSSRISAVTLPANIPITLRRITAASAGTLFSTSDIVKKHSSSSASTAELRTANVTATFAQDTASRLLGLSNMSAVNRRGDYENEAIFGDEIVLLPGEGIALYQESAVGDTGMQYIFTMAWDERSVPSAQSLTFSISDTSIGFGNLQTGAARYATGDTVGSGSDSVAAHTISASTNAPDGYAISVSGNTLTCASCSGATITPIGGTALASSAGTEQFGLRATVQSGTGAVSSPYNGSNWAFDTSAFPDTVATGAGDEVTTVFGFRYIGNIATLSEAGAYSGAVTYTVTASF